VADVVASDPEDDVFGDVGGVVGGALEVAADDDGVEGLLGDLGMLLHDGHQFFLDSAVHLVDLVVHGEDGFGEFGVAFEEGLYGAAHHDADLLAHGFDVDGERDAGQAAEGDGAGGDVGRLIADAFQVTVYFDDGQDEAEVDRHRLLFGEELVGHLVDGGFGGVDGGLDLLDVVGEADVAREVSLDGELERLLGERGHGEELVFEGYELELEVNARHGGSPCGNCNVGEHWVVRRWYPPFPRKVCKVRIDKDLGLDFGFGGLRVTDCGEEGLAEWREPPDRIRTQSLPISLV